MNDRFEELLVQDEELKSINKGIIRLSPAQKVVFEKMKSTTQGKVTKLVRKIQDCYENLLNCSDNYNDVIGQVSLIPDEDFLISKDIFSQACDYAMYFGDSREGRC